MLHYVFLHIRDFLVKKKNIHRETEIYGETQARKEEGQTELAVYFVSYFTRSGREYVKNGHSKRYHSV